MGFCWNSFLQLPLAHSVTVWQYWHRHWRIKAARLKPMQVLMTLHIIGVHLGALMTIQQGLSGASKVVGPVPSPVSPPQVHVPPSTSCWLSIWCSSGCRHSKNNIPTHVNSTNAAYGQRQQINQQHGHLVICCLVNDQSMAMTVILSQIVTRVNKKKKNCHLYLKKLLLQFIIGHFSPGASGVGRCGRRHFGRQLIDSSRRQIPYLSTIACLIALPDDVVALSHIYKRPKWPVKRWVLSQPIAHSSYRQRSAVVARSFY